MREDGKRDEGRWVRAARMGNAHLKGGRWMVVHPSGCGVEVPEWAVPERQRREAERKREAAERRQREAERKRWEAERRRAPAAPSAPNPRVRWLSASVELREAPGGEWEVCVYGDGLEPRSARLADRAGAIGQVGEECRSLDARGYGVAYREYRDTGRGAALAFSCRDWRDLPWIVARNRAVCAAARAAAAGRG